ncbi:hypothetical protein CMO96_00695 [Candidatus Woesebacteria bacterium]|nr:hypothetical protein [Candidatus Woesebacteria bacterium]|tara:strand:+ start:613 stop:1185 length:573 start_codon:yes stop_codon:yes gene_type:complete
MRNKNKNDREIEVRFLDVNVNIFLKKLKSFQATDLGEALLKEIIFYDMDKTWGDQGKFVRLRKIKKESVLSFKHHQNDVITGTKEIEFKVDNFERAKSFLKNIGLVAVREQEKKRHSFILEGVMIDLDTWPSIPTYIELEGKSRRKIKSVARILGLNWNQAVYENAKIVIEKYYKVPVSSFRYFTFSRIG